MQVKHININNQTITHIIHIADLHIRTGNKERARITEYRHVFDKFITEVSSLPCVNDGSAMMVVCGDIFHDKGKIESEGAILAYEFFGRLMDLLPVVVIAGNHDLRQNDPDYTDMVTMLAAPFINADAKASRKHPMIYLKETGAYQFCNVGVGVVAIGDTLREFNTAGIVDELPPFVDPSTMVNSDCRVALFHGTINRSKMQNGREIGNEKGYPIEWFKGYDIVALGDNHKQQLNTCESGCTWGYPGSLVQQDYGEPLFGHGYILWDIKKKTGELRHINNEYGAVTVVGKRVRVDLHDYRDMQDALHEPWFPKRAKVRIVARPSDTVSETSVLADMREAGIEPSRTNVVTSIGKSTFDIENNNNETEIGSQLDQLLRFNDPTLWCEFVDAVSMGVADWLHKPRSMLIPYTDALPKALREKIEKRNGDIIKYIEDYENARGGATRSRHRIALKHMAWSYIMCYGAGNHFDFESLDGNVCLLNGQNACGKSSFLDAICIGLYGEPTSCRIDQNATALSGGFVHRQKPVTNRDQAEVRIILSVDDVQYEIRRSFAAREKENEIKKQALICTVHRLDGADMHLVADGTTTVKDWVESRLGSKEELLMGVMLSQFDVVSFVDRSAEEQRQYLEKALSIDVITSYERVLKEAYNAYKMVRKEVTDLASMYGGTSNVQSSVTAEQIEVMQQQLDVLEAQISSRQNRIDELISIVGNTSMKDQYADELQYNDDNDYDYSSIKPSSFADEYAVLSHRMKEHKRIGESIQISDMDIIPLSKAEKMLECVLSEEPSHPQLSRTYIEEKLASIDINDDIEYTSEQLENIEKQLAAAMENAVHKTKSEIKDKKIPKINLEKARKAHATARAALDDILSNEPTNTRPREQLDDIITTSEKWFAKFPTDWITDATIPRELLTKQALELSELNKQLSEHLRNPVERYERETTYNQCDAGVCLDELRTQIKKFNESIDELQRIARPKSGYEEWKRKWSEWKDKVSNQKVPSETLDVLRSMKDKLVAKLAKVSSKTMKKLQLEGILSSVREELSAMDDIPFNPDCWACCKQPHRMRREALETKLSDTINQLAEYEGIEAKTETYKKELERLENSIRVREWYDTNSPTMESEKATWDASRKYWKEIAAMVEQRDEMRALIWNLWNSECYRLQIRADELHNSVSILREFCESYDAKKHEYESAKDELSRCDAYMSWLKYKQNAESIVEDAWHTEWVLWDSLVKNLQEQIRKMRSAIESRELRDALRVLDEWDAWDTRRAAAQLAVEAARWHSEDAELCTKYKLYTSFRVKLARELASARTEQTCDKNNVNQLREELVRIRHVFEQQQERQNMFNTIEALRIQYAAAEAQLEKLQERFIGASTKGSSGGFKEYVYREHMLPIVQTEVNSFLAAIDGFRLNIRYADRKLLFFVEDRGNTTPIRLASGYQRFLLGLAIRATLCRIGALGGNMGFLIIDEGFVSLDIDNMGKVRDILDALMTVGGYNMILMTSHLESIRDTAQMFINIDRPVQSPFSKLTWGKQYPALFKRHTFHNDEEQAANKPKRARKSTKNV